MTLFRYTVRGEQIQNLTPRVTAFNHAFSPRFFATLIRHVFPLHFSVTLLGRNNFKFCPRCIDIPSPPTIFVTHHVFSSRFSVTLWGGGQFQILGRFIDIPPYYIRNASRFSVALIRHAFPSRFSVTGGECSTPAYKQSLFFVIYILFRGH